jgi:hypothetical protein
MKIRVLQRAARSNLARSSTRLASISERRQEGEEKKVKRKKEKGKKKKKEKWGKYVNL